MAFGRGCGSPQSGCCWGNSTPDGILQLEGEANFFMSLGHEAHPKTMFSKKLNGPPLTGQQPTRPRESKRLRPSVTSLRTYARPKRSVHRLRSGMSASTAAKSNACTKPTNTRCGSQSELTSNARTGRNECGAPSQAAISGKRPAGPAFKNEPERAKAPYDLGARCMSAFSGQDLSGLRVHPMPLCVRKARHLDVGEVIIIGLISPHRSPPRGPHSLIARPGMRKNHSNQITSVALRNAHKQRHFR